MLLLASRILEQELRDEERLRLLEKLREKRYLSLIRSMRLKFFDQMVGDSRQASEMERTVAAHVNSEQRRDYVQGDLFFADDHLFFILFGGQELGTSQMRAGVVYEPQTAQPLRKLNAFCQTINLCLTNHQSDENQTESATSLTRWRQDTAAFHQGFMRFVARQDADTLSAIACRENSRERVRASKMLEDDYARLFLRRAREAYSEGYSVSSSMNEAAQPSELALNNLLAAGLLRQELLVSCRRSNHTLFNLPSADALAVVTISNATCSICGARIADEKIEEVLMPTQLAAVLLEDAAWLVNRLHAIFRELGIAESEIAIEPPAGDGEARLMARVCGETFLVVMRDGDLTPAFARRAVNTKIEMDARHLVVVVTGTVHNEGRVNLLRFADQLERAGNDFEMIIAEGVSAAESELKRVFERVSHRVLAEQFCELDASLGLNVACLIRTRFELLQRSGQTQTAHAALASRQEELPSTRLLT